LSLALIDPKRYQSDVNTVISWCLDIAVNLQNHDEEGNVTELPEVEPQCHKTELKTTGLILKKYLTN
jgi:hypothetical protein